LKKLGWKGWLIIITCAVVILGMGSTAIANVKGFFNKDNSDDNKTTTDTTTAQVLVLDEVA